MASLVPQPRHGIDFGGAALIDFNGRNSYNISMKTTVSEKGQVTIPKRLRERLGLRNGTVLEVQEQRGRLIMTKKPSRDPYDKYFGILKLGRRTDDIINQLRGEGPLR
jgi:antitoxin PrlF